jgi:hypothetical protein
LVRADFLLQKGLQLTAASRRFLTAFYFFFCVPCSTEHPYTICNVLAGQQEPESNSDILRFAKAKGVDFTMMEKVNVNGPKASLVYKYLKQQTNHQSIGWNFGKLQILCFKNS